MRMKALFSVVALALMCCPAQGLAEITNPQETATKATYLIIYRPGPGVVDWKICDGAATQRAWEVHAEPLHQRFHEAGGSSYRQCWRSRLVGRF
jgi:hypothetical protein